MSRYRAFALRASLAAALAATMGAVTLSTGTASAAPVQPNPTIEAAKYPPTPPKLTVNRGSVKTGQTVRASGRKYIKRERVTIIIRFKPKGSSNFRTVNEKTIRADRNGRFTVSLRLARVGTVTIKGRGHTSKLSSTAYVRVTKGRNNGSWTLRLVSYEAGTAAGAGTATVAKPAAETTTSSNGIALAGLGALALIGSAGVGHQVVRRRRRRTDVAA